MILLALIGLGLILGSFVNAFVWRLHEGRDWVRERSECTKCHHVLAAKDLVPVFSWLLLRGKCRYCNARIEDNPIAELLTPLLFAISYLAWPYSFDRQGVFLFAFWLLFLVGFVALALYDFRWFLLPDKIVFVLAGLALYQVIMQAFFFDKDWRILVSGLAGAILISGLFFLIFMLSKGAWIGFGDVKLGIVLGLLCGGILEGFLLLFVASLVGMVVSVPLLVRGKANHKTPIPFGPFLILGVIVVYLVGAHIISWYQGLLYV